MRRILLINPNSSEQTTSMMVTIASREVTEGIQVLGATARNGPSMIVSEAELRGSATEVERLCRELGAGCDGIIIGAFGDPAVASLRRSSVVPVVGLGEASMLEAAHGGRRFGVATVTPELVASIDQRAAALGLKEHYTGVRLAHGDPLALTDDPEFLLEALAGAVSQCIRDDGAEAVVIGGGPLGQAAMRLGARFEIPIIAPIPAAIRSVLRHKQ